MKKTLVILMVMALVLAACGGNQNNQGGGTESTTSVPTSGATSSSTSGDSGGGAPDATTVGDSSDPVVISMMNWEIASSFSEDGSTDRMLGFVQDKFNIRITPIDVSWEDAEEKSIVWAAAGSLPDVIGAQAMPGTARYYQWISDGVVRALPDNLDSYPEVKRVVAQPEVQAYAVNNQSYLLPRQTYSESSWWCMDRAIINRKDWREALNIPVPETEEDFIEMWAAFSKSDPNGDGATVYGMGPTGLWIFYSQCFTTYGFTADNWTKMADGSLVIPTLEPNTLPLMSFLRRAYATGGIDPDFVTYSSNDARDRFGAGRLGTLLRQASPKHLKVTSDVWDQIQKDKKMIDCIEILKPPAVDGVTPVRFSGSAYWSESYVNSGVDDEKIEKILEFYDFFYTDEGLRMLLYGFEGEDYEMQGDDIVLLTAFNPDTGRQFVAGDLYRYAFSDNGGMNAMVAWTADLLQYVDPAIPKPIRDLATSERDFRLANWAEPTLDYRIFAIDIPEKVEMSAIRFWDDWANFIIDTSGAPDEDLYAAMYANWEANGYKAAKDAMTKSVADMGY
jgi:putative aldouronate transport system substrate-binding protein